MFEKLARLLEHWHVKLKHWHVLWHVGTFIGKLVHKKLELGTLLARWYAGTLALKPRWMQVRWHVDHVGTQDTHGTHDTWFSKLAELEWKIVYRYVIFPCLYLSCFLLLFQVSAFTFVAFFSKLNNSWTVLYSLKLTYEELYFINEAIYYLGTWRRISGKISQ